MKEDFQMPEFRLPQPEDQEVVSEEENRNYGRFVLEPLERGFGITLGNALRRVLLSSITGSAVVGVTIAGARHEYEVLKGVTEDPTMIVLNLKGLVVRLDESEEELNDKPVARVIKLDVVNDGDIERKVTARDFEGFTTLEDGAFFNHRCGVEIINPDCEIATVAPGGKLKMSVFLGTGRGYSSAEENKARFNDQLGSVESGDSFPIPMDSSFSPIRKVNYSVIPTRVKRETDFDKLTLDVWTDGSVEAKSAVIEAAEILCQYFQLFVKMSDHLAPDQAKSIFAQSDEDDKSESDDKPIESLELSVRSYNCLKRAGISTIGELTGKTEEEMMKVRNLGKKSLKEVKDKLTSMGLSFKNEK